MDKKELLITSSMSSEPSACLWDYNTLNTIRLFKNGGVITPNCLEIIGQDFMVGSELGKPILHVWKLNGQECSKNSRLILPGVATCLALCPKNIYLAAGIDSKVYVWQLSSGKLLSVHQKNFQAVNVIKFSSDGDYLLVAGKDGIATVYNFVELINLSNSFLTQTDIGQVEPIYIKSDHSASITDLHVGSFGRKSLFATVSIDKTCRIYKLADGEALLNLAFNEEITAIVFDVSCRHLYVGNTKGGIYQCNLKNPPRKLYHHVEERNSVLFKGHTAKIICISINNINTLLASGSDDNLVCIWEISSRHIKHSIDHKSPITNIKFVLNYQNFFVDRLKPCNVLKTLQRSVSVSGNKLPTSQIQTNDIDLNDEATPLETEHVLTNLTRENMKLRSVNRQLYKAALEISKKYYNGCH